MAPGSASAERAGRGRPRHELPLRRRRGLPTWMATRERGNQPLLGARHAPTGTSSPEPVADGM
eukprot:226701-Lingulodinium_polyedra.AAC.1